MKQKIAVVRRGFSLAELLVVFAVLAVLLVGAIGAFSPRAQTSKARDIRRKKDLARIRVAFEDFYNDKGCYPKSADYNFGDSSKCHKNFFSPWLSPWPCDPSKQAYYFVLAEAECPKWFEVMANLENKNDSDIPQGWYEGEINLANGLTNKEVNYGVSSTNVKWNDLQ
jgi:prepilin-type N-terminal cleavage/methylation domain-containing protein